MLSVTSGAFVFVQARVMASAIPISKLLSDFMNYFPLLPAEPIDPDPADPSASAILGRAAALNYQLENVEGGKRSTKEEANQGLRRPLDLPRFLCRGGRFRPRPAVDGSPETLRSVLPILSHKTPAGWSIRTEYSSG